MKAGLVSDIGESAVAVVVKKNVVSPEATEQVVPSIVVVVSNADAGLPAGAGKSGFVGYVGEGSVAVVLVQMRPGGLPGRPVFAEARSIGQINIEPAVVVVIEERDPAALGFDDVALVIDRAPDIGNVESGFAGYVYELHGRGRIGGRGGLKSEAVLPVPQRRGECVDERVGENDKRRAEKTSPATIHFGLGIFGKSRGITPTPSFTAMI